MRVQLLLLFVFFGNYNWNDPFFLQNPFSLLVNSNRNTLTDEGIELVLTVMEAKELIGPADAEQFDTFVRIYMIPDETVPQQTKV